MKPIKLLALDIGERRIGVAAADTGTKIAYPLTTLDVSDDIIERIEELIAEQHATELVIGFPRNLSGETTAQTATVQKFAVRLEAFGLPIHFQDETLTSVAAEAHLSKGRLRHQQKGSVDAHAAAIILTDYVEDHHA